MSKVEATVTGSNPSGVSLCVVVVISLKYEFHSTLIERVCVLVSWNVKRHRGSGCSLLHCHFYYYRLERNQIYWSGASQRSPAYKTYSTIIPIRGDTGRRLAPNIPQCVMLLLWLFVYDLTVGLNSPTEFTVESRSST